MSKTIKTFDEAKEALGDAKDSKKAVKAELKAFDKKNKVKKGDASNLKSKAAGKREKLITSVENAETKIAETKDLMKSLKPKKERISKYVYPEDIKGDSKAEKRYRAKVRGKAKAAGMTVDEYLKDPEAADKIIDGKKSKKSKKDKKKDKKSKKDKKDKKEEVEDEEEEEADDDGEEEAEDED